MVKLIASDLDGTLLDGNGSLPERLFPVIGQLHERGILFAPASGRQYANLELLFRPVKDKVLFVAENGALVKYRGKTLRLTPVSEREQVRVLAAVRAEEGLYPVLCGENHAYMEKGGNDCFRATVIDAYTNCVQVDRLEEVIGRESICKVAVFDERPAAEHCVRVLPSRLPSLRAILSSFHWMDISSLNANKGEAIRFVQEKFHFLREECVAFGDHMNDYEMLAACGRAYVPENGFAALKERIGSTVPSNLEGGALEKIEAILAEETA